MYIEETEIEVAVRVRIRTVRWQGPWEVYRRANLLATKVHPDTQESIPRSLPIEIPDRED